LVSELPAHQKLAHQVVNLLDKETNVEKNHKIVILRNLINSHFLWTEINETFKQRKNELQVDLNIDYPDENFESELKSWTDVLEEAQKEKDKIYEESERLCRNIYPDELNNLKNKYNEDYCSSIKEFFVEFILHEVTLFIKELEECLEDNRVDYEQLDEEYKFREQIKNISYEDLEEYFTKTSNYIESKKKTEPEILKSIDLQYQDSVLTLFQENTENLLKFKSIKEGKLFSFLEIAFDGVDGVPREGSQSKFKEMETYQLTYLEFVEVSNLGHQIISSITGKGKNVKKLAKSENSKSKIFSLTAKSEKKAKPGKN